MSQFLRALTLAVVPAIAVACVRPASPPAPSVPVATTTSAGPDVSERIRRVEHGLRLMHVVRGDSASGMSLTERLRYHNVPGVSVVVVNDGRIEWARAWGEVEAGSGKAVDTTTLFQAASISKPVAAAAALRLVEEGVLSLDEDVNRRLTTWKVPASAHSATEPVTLRRLLSHTAGTTVSGFPGYSASVTVPSVVQVLNGETPTNTKPIVVDTVPGTLHRYSGGGYTIAQLLVADAAGRPFPDVAREKVLVPVGMSRSTFAQPLPPEMHAAAATAHSFTGQPIPGKYHTYPEMAAAGLWTTPSDLARFGIEIRRALNGERGRILSPEMARQMVTPPPGSPRYALGFALEGAGDSLWFSHGGSNAGFQSYFLMSARGQGLVVMTNGSAGLLVGQEIVRSIVHEYGWPVHRAIERDAIALDSATLAAFVGTYVRPAGEGTSPFLMQVELVGGELVATVPTARWTRRPMRASAPERFFFLASPGALAFERDAAGKAVAVNVTGLGQPLRLVRQ